MDSVELVDLFSDMQLSNVFKFDSIHGEFKREVSYRDGKLNVNGKEIAIYAV